MLFSCEDFVNKIKNCLSNSFDILDKTLTISNKKIIIVYLKTITDDTLLSNVIFEPMLKYVEDNISTQQLKNNIIKSADIKEIANISNNIDKLADEILLGSVAIYIENETSAVVIDVKKFPARNPEEPPTSSVIFGPRVGFTENVEINIAMLRRKLPTKDFVAKSISVGKYTKTKILLTYINKVASKDTVKKIENKLKQINIDGVVDSHYLVDFLQEKKSFYKQVGLAEKPDIITAKLLEGRIAILVDGSPIVLSLPFMVFEDLQSSNDYYSNHIYSSFIRIIRLIGILVASVIPGVYLALRLYHYKILPLRFLITITNSTANLPFTPFIELLFILVLFQILYEVSLRLPQYLGLATSIVGALILGQTGVNAGLISPPGVVIIAMSIIAIYTVSDQSSQLTILRIIFLVIGGTIGLLGIVGALIYFVNDLSSINNYGTPYLAPYGPRIDSDLKDGLFLSKMSKNYTRPKSIKTKNKVRLKK